MADSRSPYFTFESNKMCKPLTQESKPDMQTDATKVWEVTHLFITDCEVSWLLLPPKLIVSRLMNCNSTTAFHWLLYCVWIHRNHRAVSEWTLGLSSFCKIISLNPVVERRSMDESVYLYQSSSAASVSACNYSSCLCGCISELPCWSISYALWLFRHDKEGKWQLVWVFKDKYTWLSLLFTSAMNRLYYHRTYSYNHPKLPGQHSTKHWKALKRFFVVWR